MSRRRIPIIPTILVLAAAGVMVALGVWQLGRLEEKEALIARYAANADMEVLRVREGGNLEEFLYRQAEFDCSSPGEWRAIAGRNAAGQAGYSHEFVCAEAIGREFDDVTDVPGVFAAIGWSRGPQRPDWNGGAVQGTLAPAGDDYRIVASSGLARLEPLARPDPSDLPNNHLAYAGQWFFFALTALVIYGLALRRRWREQS